MSKEETSVVVHTTLGAMSAQNAVEKEYGMLKNFAVVYVTVKSPDKYIVCFQYTP